MTLQEKNDLIQELYRINRAIRSTAVRDFMRTGSIDQYDFYIEERRRLNSLISALENSTLSDISNEFNLLNSDLKTGIKRVDEVTTNLETTRKVINGIKNIVDFAARIVALIP